VTIQDEIVLSVVIAVCVVVAGEIATALMWLMAP
jgi:hypothetical protein